VVQIITVNQTIPLPVGKTTPLLRVDQPTVGEWDIKFTLDADSVLLSLYVGSLASGSLTVTAYAVADEGKEVEIVTFPTITGPTANLLLRKAAVSLSIVRVHVASTGLATLDLRARGISAGETSVKIVGASELVTSQLTVGTSPVSLLASALTDRLGVVIRNWSTTDTVYVAETPLKATPGLGYPLGPGESLGLDLQAGQEVYGVADPTSADIRVMQAGAS
jgi:hypothetical protein